ncbi:MAG: hypothetical protein ACREEM_42685 [Blastocatellia bacterium]
MPHWRVIITNHREGEHYEDYNNRGADIAKNVFQIHGVDEPGKVVLRKTLKRDKVTQFFAQLPPCLIGIEACGSAHYWARTLARFGHTVRLMAGQFVAP